MFRRHWIASVLFLVTSATLLGAQSSYRLIEQAYQKGQLTADEKILLEVQSVKRPSALPVAYQSSVIEINKCATEILLEAQRSWKDLSPATQEALKDVLARPSATFTYDSPGGKFKIHYNTSGTNAVPTADTSPANGVPDYVDWLASYADSSYRAEVINLGQYEPPSDGSAGGDSKYDIYTEEMPYYGYTQYEGPGPNPWNDGYSYISVHRNFIGFPPNTDPDGDQKGAAKVTVAHEYYHAIQFAYNFNEDLWLMEASSTWMEDQVFNPVNDNYNYLSDWFSYPDYSLNSSANLHVYAAFIWPKFLSQNFTPMIMPEIWNQCISMSSYPALTAVLGTHGTNIASQFGEFAVWNFITGSRSDGLHFQEAANYPLITTVRTHTTYPVSGQGPVAGRAPDALGANYVIFNLPSGAGQFTIDFNGDNSTTWIVKVLGWKSQAIDVYQEFSMILNASGDGSFVLTNPQDFTSAVLVISNVSQTLNDRSYTYGASFVSGPQYAVAVNAAADDSVYSHSTGQLKYLIHNTGSATETYNITAGDSRGWNPVPSRSSITIANGATDSVNVGISCPSLTLQGVKDTVYLTATTTSIVGISSTDSASAVVFYQHGDADNSGNLDISDAVYLIGYIFSGGGFPMPVMETGDADCDGAVDISDAVFLIQYIFSSGSPPPCNPL